jgi:hypothetical protein
MVTYYVTTDFFYNGAETLPYKVVELNQEDVAYVDTTFYTYSNGFVSLDSSLNYVVSSQRWLYTNVIAFSVTGNKVFVRIKDIYRFSTYEDSATLTITRQNGNIIMQQDPNNTITENIQMTYDNKVNPFYRGDIHYPIYYEHLFNSFNAQKNNPLEQSFSIGSSTSRIKYQYTYRSDGYPLTVTKTDLTYSSQSRKGIFIYTR